MKLKLKNICEVKNGSAYKPEEWSKEGFKIVRIQNLNGSLDYNLFNGNTEKKVFINNGDVLFSWSGSFGAFRWLQEKALLNQHIFKVIPKEGINKDFLYLSLKYNTKELEKLSHGGGGLVHIKKGDFENFEIYVPKNQDLIVNELFSQENKIKKIKKLLEKIEIRNNYYADKLLSGELSVGEDGKILNVQNNNYKLKKIKEIVDISIGSTPSIEEYNGNIPWITIADLSKNIEQTNKQLKKSIKSVEAGSLIISFKLTVGLAKIIHQESCTNEAILRIEPSKIKEDVSIDYLYCILPNLLKQYSGKNAYGASILNTKEIKEIPVKIFRDHKNISGFLKSLEDEKNKVTKLLQLEQQRFEWLSDKLLSGEYIIED